MVPYIGAGAAVEGKATTGTTGAAAGGAAGAAASGAAGTAASGGVRFASVVRIPVKSTPGYIYRALHKALYIHIYLYGPIYKHPIKMALCRGTLKSTLYKSPAYGALYMGTLYIGTYI